MYSKQLTRNLPQYNKTLKTMYSITQVKKSKEIILNDITEGKSLNEICNRKGIPDSNTVYKWLNKDAKFRDNYVRARQDQAMFYAEKMQKVIIDLPENPTREQIDKARLTIDTDKFIASKLLPKVYGTNANNTNIQVNVQPVTGMKIVDIEDNEAN